ncbi:WD40/YVTN/BNR-like repeat-containing protein [Micromonospora sp. H33]|uniref:WD40/YVTN/BNR-like repeat-containing protein n=1 Tax=Micromonospora sp. H33 TaxID=3452215 RepID=UPI003F88677F
MSDREFTGFDTATVADAVRQPPLDELWATVRARRRRRVAGMALVAVVVTVGMTAVPLGDRSPGVDWATPEPTATREDRGTRLFLTGGDSAVGVEHRSCVLRFAHTRDAGRTWSDYATAVYQVPGCRPDENGMASTDLRFTVLDERSYLVLHNGERHLSTDHGRTWRSADEAMVTVTAFPRVARPVFCQEGCGAMAEPLATDPGTGTVYRLRGEPVSPYPPFSIYPAADGAIWVTYWPGDADLRATVARSVDRGATWRTSKAPAGASVTAVAAVSGTEAYLLTEPDPPPGTEPMKPGVASRLLHTTDGGRTWTDVGTDLPSTPVVRGFTIGADGSLMISDSRHEADRVTDHLLVSRDGGRHFTRVRENGREGGTGVAPGSAWLYGRDDMSVLGPDHVQLTTDGETWVRFSLPD